MRIAICDDDKACRSEAARLVQEYIQQSSRAIGLTVYENGTDLLEDARRTGSFDIYLLDILMPLLDGIELGIRLRELDADCKIIYLTSSPDYAIPATRARVWEYLLKPVKKEVLFPSLDEAFATLAEKREKGIVVKTGQGSIRLNFDSILYADLNKKSIHYHLTNGKVIESISIRTGFSEAMQNMLRDSRFFMCSASMAINLYHVGEINHGTLTFQNGKTLLLSRNVTRELRSVWSNFWMNKEGIK